MPFVHINERKYVNVENSTLITRVMFISFVAAVRGRY